MCTCKQLKFFNNMPQNDHWHLCSDCQFVKQANVKPPRHLCPLVNSRLLSQTLATHTLCSLLFDYTWVGTTMSQKSRARPQQPTSAQLLRLEFKEVVEDAMGCQFGSSFVLSVPGSLTVKELMSEVNHYLASVFTSFPYMKPLLFKKRSLFKLASTTPRSQNLSTFSL